MILKGFQGEIGIAIKNLDNNETLFVNETTKFPSARVVKLSVLVELYIENHEKKVDLDKTILISKEQMALGSGILKQLNPNIPLTLRDMARLMIIVSDCSAYNRILEIVGIDNVNQRMKKLGLNDSQVTGKIEYAKDAEKVGGIANYGIGYTTPRDMMFLLENIARGQIVDTYTSQTIEEILSSNMNDDRIPRLLPPEAEVAHKTGTTSLVRNDVGFIKSPNGTYVVVVLTNNIKDLRGSHENDAVITIATISQLTYNYFSSQ